MLGASALVLAATALMLVGALAVFGWALFTGRLDDPGDAAEVIFAERDLRLARPWETREQAEERLRAYGPAVQPEPGEWGGW